ncbi:CHAT domain-containing protein [Aquimarina sp. MMG016]|uniref:CHAT domain-containing protein n=1 Tax=Aquimarina sp. MMG016 TaxID=2822690 RepID=UPI001B39D69D|nr:CHAT domain-containing protein [Aquimarina sp. MMG016]MBQ4822811.1 CHAT domain-containing protein [Aquimarina sp. MMG016]
MIALQGSNFLMGKACGITGNCYEKIGDLYKSVEYQEKAFQYFDSVKQKKQILYNHINISASYKYIRNKESALKGITHLKKADSILNIMEKPDPYTRYDVYNNLGNFYYEGVGVKDLSKALTSFNKALNISLKYNIKENLSTIYCNLAIVNIKLNTKLSKKYFDQSLKYSSNSPDLTPNIYLGLGLGAIHEKRNLEAHEYFQKAFSAYYNKDIDDIYWLPSPTDLLKIEDKTTLLEIFKRKLKAWIELGKTKNNPSYYEEAIKVILISDQLIDLIIKDNLSFRSKLFWRDLASEIYIMGLEACLYLKKYDKAFYFIEKNKALLLLQEVIKNNNTLPSSIKKKVQVFKDEISVLRNQLYTSQTTKKDSVQEKLLDTKTKYKKFEDSLAHSYPFYHTSIIPNIIELPELKLSKDQAVIQYIMAEKVANVTPDGYLMFLTSNTKELFKIENTKSLQKSVFNLREKLNSPFKTDKDVTEYDQLANQIYKTLIPKEIQNDIKNKQITIVPDHIINLIPFEALVTDPVKRRYLIEESEINYTYSLSFSKENSSIVRNPEKDFLGVAPIHFSNGLTTLSKSKKELTYPNDYYNGTIFTNKNATKENFVSEAGNYRILHLATHADASDSIAPWIAFRNSKLTLAELSTIKNNAELVVLSACNTSIGEVRRGEGVMSLARGFFKSGANTVIPSLWSTNDKATATITSDFYKNLSKGLTRSEALRSAKLNYLKKNTDAEASPHYWASLILIGDTEMLIPNPNYNTLIYIIFIGLILLFLTIYGYRKINK